MPETARRLRRAGERDPVPAHDALVRMIRRWERIGLRTERYELLYAAALGIEPDRLPGSAADCTRPTQPASSLPVRGVDPVTEIRLRALTPAQFDELLAHLRDQWHALVKTDNLLGPRHAVTGVHEHLAIISALLRTSRPPLRAEVLRLGAQYAESAAWLHEDSGDMEGSRYWTGISMEWAVEADDRHMVSWSLFRRSQQARADGDAAQVIGLAAAARRERGILPPPMLAAILQQEAQGHALDGGETACHALLDQAHAYAADPNDPGDARTGHGSFCTPGYLEMQRGSCWLALGRPSKAVAPYKTALRELPAVYRRDRGVALAGLAAAFAAGGEAEEAAQAALEALGIARSAGSARILNMVKPVADALPGYAHVPGVVSLREALAETPAV